MPYHLATTPLVLPLTNVPPMVPANRRWGCAAPRSAQRARATPEDQSGRWDSNPRPSPWQGDVLPLNHARKSVTIPAESAESQNRTDDTAIFSRVLYQLSYLGQENASEANGILLDEEGVVKQRLDLDGW